MAKTSKLVQKMKNHMIRMKLTLINQFILSIILNTPTLILKQD